MRWSRWCTRNLVLGLIFLSAGAGLTIGSLLPGFGLIVLIGLAMIAAGYFLLR